MIKDGMLRIDVTAKRESEQVITVKISKAK